MPPRVIVFTWLTSVGKLIEEALIEDGIDSVFRTTWTLEVLCQVETFAPQCSEMVVIIDRGAFSERIEETNWMTRMIRKIAPRVRVLRIGAVDDFPPSAKGDKFWSKAGYNLDQLTELVKKLLGDHAHV